MLITGHSASTLFQDTEIRMLRVIGPLTSRSKILSDYLFAQYFKKGAIKPSRELPVNVYGLDPDEIYVSYFESDAVSGIGLGDEAVALWRAVGVYSDHMVPGDIKDNF